MTEKNISHIIKCYECKGTGKEFDIHCETCFGIGTIDASDTLVKYYLPVYN